MVALETIKSLPVESWPLRKAFIFLVTKFPWALHSHVRLIRVARIIHRSSTNISITLNCQQCKEISVRCRAENNRNRIYFHPEARPEQHCPRGSRGHSIVLRSLEMLQPRKQLIRIGRYAGCRQQRRYESNSHHGSTHDAHHAEPVNEHLGVRG